MDIGRNDPCRCGSGKKYKKCCLAKDEAAERESSAKKWAQALEQKKAQDQQAAEQQPGKSSVAPHPHGTPPVLKGGQRKFAPMSGSQVRIPPKTGGG